MTPVLRFIWSPPSDATSRAPPPALHSAGAMSAALRGSESAAPSPDGASLLKRQRERGREKERERQGREREREQLRPIQS